jgi:hypothetical protein
MRDIKFSIICAMVVMIAAGAVAQDKGGTVFSATRNLGPALRMRSLLGESTTVNVYSNCTGEVVFRGTGVTNTINATAYSNVSTFAGHILALTNSDGNAMYDVDYDCSYGTDSIDGEVLTSNTTFSAGKWATPFVFQLSSNKFLNAYLPGADVGGQGGARRVTKIVGSIGGTGNVDLVVYKNRVKVWDKQIRSPYYVIDGSTATSSSASTNQAVNHVNLNEDVSIPCGARDNIQIRATRATGIAAPGTIAGTADYL